MSHKFGCGIMDYGESFIKSSMGTVVVAVLVEVEMA